MASYSAGGTSPSSPCSRRWLNQSMYSATAISTSSMPRHGPFVADQLRLEQRVEGLGQRIVIGVTTGADRGDRSFLGQPLRIPHRHILHAAVGMVNQPGQIIAGPLAGPDAHVE